NVEQAIRVSNGKRFDSNLVKVSRVLLVYLEKVCELRDWTEVDHFNNTKKLLTPMARGTFESFAEYFETDKFNDMSAVYGHYNAFWLSKSMSFLMTIFSLITVIFAKFPESLRAIWNRDYRGSKRVTANTVFIPRQKCWFLPEWSKGRVQRKYFSDYEKNKRGVRCRLIRHAKKPENDTLVLHIHGGGFVTHTPDSHEMYLRHWASNIAGVPILSIDYSTNVEYPIALQEVLDVYLWVISGHSKVKQMLGFHPKKIVLCGDSAGGVLCITLCAVLHDIRKILERNKEPIKLLFPSSFVGIYTTFNLHHLSPSLLLSLIEPVLGTGPLLACIGLYSLGVRYDHDFEAIEKVHLLLRIWNRKPWFRCDLQLFQQRMKYISHVADHPYINALNSEFMESVENMSIYLVTSHFDILLDNNVEFAKNFKGNIVLDVVDDVSHGYLHWCFVSKEAMKGSDLCLKRLQQAIGYY
ncbi:hypothetical protein B4U80_03260, partial [Leptotrombidium deliense]